MEIVFSFIFSNDVIYDDKKYGSIGIVFALMSFLIAIGVVILLGAVFGVVWPRTTPKGELRRPSVSERLRRIPPTNRRAS
jgi:uncharacterized BrkB/YihY/UPF0761 family membrane protein